MHVLEPLNITSLGFGPPSRLFGHGPRVRLGSLMLGKGVPAPPGDIRSDNPPLLTPAGRMHLTMADWASFQRVFLNEGRPLLSVESFRHLLVIPDRRRHSMAMGWVSAKGLGGSYGMQGSNTRWAATAIIDADSTRTAIIVANDGRTRILQRSAALAVTMLQPHRQRD